MTMPDTAPVRPEANWYADPTTPGLERFWDGLSWTSNVRPSPTMYVAPAAAATPVSTSNTLSIIAIVLGILALLFFPIVFGPVGLALAAVGKKKGESLATVGLIVAGVGMALGMLAGVLFAVATF